MTSPLTRAVLSCAGPVAFFACTLPALAADADLTPVTSALTTTLTSDDVFVNTTLQKKVERQLSIAYSAKATGPCQVTIHRDGTSTYPYIGRIVVQLTDAVTYYMLPLAAMSSGLTTSNEKSAQQAVLSVSGANQNQIYTFSEDTVVPLAGLKTAGIEPVAVSSQSTPMRYPTYTSANAAKAAIAALATAAAACAK